MIGVVACHYNPAGFVAPVRNWFAWKNHLPHEVVLSTVELAFDNPKTDADLVIEAHENHIMWQKEALLNVAIKRLPAEVDNVAWIDADIICDDPDWLTKTEEALKHAPLVQMFNGLTQLGKTGNVLMQRQGAVAGNYARLTCPGGAFACRREIIENTGIYPFCIVGSGDCALLSAAQGQWLHNWAKPITVSHRRNWLLWGRDFYHQIKNRIGFVDVQVSHLYHGSRSCRQYDTRASILLDNDFDPSRHVYLDDNGVLTWTNEAPEKMRAGMRRYFLDRQEDI